MHGQSRVIHIVARCAANARRVFLRLSSTQVLLQGSDQRPTMPRLTPTTIAISIALALSGASSSAFALGLGNLDIRSHLGEPLRAVVPVRLDAGETLEPGCVRLMTHGGEDGVPTAPGARVAIERISSGSAALVITTQAPLNEPIVRVLVDVGCTSAITRDFVMLIDPPAVAPMAAAPAAPAAPAEVTTPAAAVAAAPATAVAQAAPRRPAPNRPTASATPKPRPSKPVASNSAPVATRTPARAEPRGTDRLRLVEPSSAVTSGMRVADSLPAVVSTSDERAAKFRDDQARLAAVLQDKDPSAVPSAREAQLAQQLQNLGSEIEALKKQMAEQSVRAQAERSASAPMWALYLLGAITAISLGLVAFVSLRGRRSRGVMVGAPWWADTLMRTDADKVAGKGKAAPQPAAPVEPPRPVMTSTDPDVVYPKPASGVTATQPGRVSTRRPFDHDADLSERVQDTTIEVHELGATQALQVLKRTTPAADIPKPDEDGPLPDALKPRAGAGPKFDASMTLSSIDFDLGTPSADERGPETIPQAIHSGEIPVLPPVDAEPGGDVWASASTADAPAPALAVTPAFLTRQPQAMTWSDARQAQDYLRQIAEAIEQADAYIAAGQAESAASVLRKLISDRQGAPRAPWLMLLQLYHKTEKREAYEALAQRFSERFGRRAAPWEAELPPHEAGLDSDPDLLQAIWARWGSPESMGLLSKLLYDNEIPDSSFLNLTLQRDLLNFVKICPLDGG